MVVKGFVLEDAAGVLSMVPAAHQEGSVRELAMEYIKKNKVLQTVYPNPGEELIDFIVRVSELSDVWRKRLEQRKPG